jgi:hypothetical protein
LNNETKSCSKLKLVIGLVIDEQLSFVKHIKHVKAKIVPITFAIRRIRPFISQKTALQLYFAHIYSHLIYMNIFWSNANATLINTLAVVQRRCLRFVYKRYSYSPSSELFSENILPLAQLNTYNLILTAFKITKGFMTNNVELSLVSNRHNYSTRQNNHYYVENYRTRFGIQNFFSRGLLAYNSLDERLKRLNSIGRFKRELKIKLIDEYLDGS